MEVPELSKPFVATPATPIAATDGVGTEREIHAVVSTGLGEPLEIFKTANAWWEDIGKVERVLECAKYRMTVEETCVTAKISRDQYYYFLKIHPKFSSIKEVLGSTVGALAKITVAEAIKGNPELAFRYLQGTQPEDYRRQVLPSLPGAGGTGTHIRKTEELFMNEAGEVLVKRQTAELLESYGTDTDTEKQG